MPISVHQDSRFGLVDALNAEWEHWSYDTISVRHHQAEICRWAERHPELRGCSSPDEVLEAIRRSPDRVLAALIATHQDQPGWHSGPRAGSHPLAGRIILQTMLGKLVSMACRDRRRGVEDYVGQLWARIATYPLAARPDRIAANLCLDTLKAVTSDRHSWPAPEREPMPMAPELLDSGGLARLHLDPAADQVADLTAHRVLRTARQIGLIDDLTGALLHSVYVDGLTSRAAGAQHGLTAAAVRARCSVAVRRLARHAEEIADVA